MSNVLSFQAVYNYTMNEDMKNTMESCKSRWRVIQDEIRACQEQGQ